MAPSTGSTLPSSANHITVADSDWQRVVSLPPSSQLACSPPRAESDPVSSEYCTDCGRGWQRVMSSRDPDALGKVALDERGTDLILDPGRRVGAWMMGG
jgi:hypothetical protein